VGSGGVRGPVLILVLLRHHHQSDSGVTGRRHRQARLGKMGRCYFVARSSRVSGGVSQDVKHSG
jgi:hypothetical protein